MPYIKVIDEDDAAEPLFSVYDEIQKTRGRVSNVLRSQSLDPKGLKAHLNLYMTLIYGKGPLGRRERELIAVVVSAANKCEYCVTHHSEALNKYAQDASFIKAMAGDYTKAKLDDKDRALCDYAYGLTVTPTEGRKDAVAALKKAGFEDDAILHATEITAYFNFVNRLAAGLGVELEDDEQRDYNY